MVVPLEVGSRPSRRPHPAAGPCSPGPPAADACVEDIELDLLLDGVRRRYGYDFREWSRANLQRRVLARMRAEGLDSVSALQALVLHDRSAMLRLLRSIAVPATALFRDPGLFRAVREDAVPLLRTRPSLRIWHAGCATGEEVYSMAVLLAEEGLLPRTRIYATDVNAELLTTAAAGRVATSRLESSERAYLAAGGRSSLTDHFAVAGEGARLHPELMARITWSEHDLASDARFNDFHLVVCANVLVYFTRPLQDRIHRLLHESLVMFGYLGLGRREMLALTPCADRYRAVPESGRLHKKVA